MELKSNNEDSKNLYEKCNVLTFFETLDVYIENRNYDTDIARNITHDEYRFLSLLWNILKDSNSRLTILELGNSKMNDFDNFIKTLEDHHRFFRMGQK